MTIPSLQLNNGTSIPQIGLGTASLDDETVARVLVSAVEAGYRHIDTAFRYGNQRGVGQGIRDCGVTREALYVTTKLDGEHQGNDRAIAGLDECLRQLSLDYVDLLLIHWPLPARNEYLSTWKTFEKLVAAGKARSIGVSNFKPAHLTRIIEATSVTPDVNQVQLSPLVARREIREFDAAYGIVTQSWSPIGQGNDLLRSPEVLAAAEREGCTPAQAVLAWHLAHGLSVVPKSSDPVRLRENLAAAGIRLSPETMAALDGMDGREAPIDSDEFGH